MQNELRGRTSQNTAAVMIVSHHEMGAVEDPPPAEPRIRYRRIGISSSAVLGTRLVENRQCVPCPLSPAKPRGRRHRDTEGLVDKRTSVARTMNCIETPLDRGKAKQKGNCPQRVRRQAKGFSGASLIFKATYPNSGAVSSLGYVLGTWSCLGQRGLDIVQGDLSCQLCAPLKFEHYKTPRSCAEAP